MSRTTDPYTLWSHETDERAEKKRAAADRPKRRRKDAGLWYYNLSEKQRRAEDDRIAHALANVEADFREVEKFELTKASLPEQPSEIRPQRQVTFRLADGSVVSSSDDEDVRPSRRPRQRTVSSSDEDAGDPPSMLKGRVAKGSSSTDDRGVGESERVAKLSNERETSYTRFHSLLEGFFSESGGSDADSTSSSLTKADVIRKRRERIEKRQNLVDRICYGHRSSSDDSGLKRSFVQTSVLTGSPPSKLSSGAANSSSRTDDRESGRVEPETSGAFFHDLSKKDVNRGSASSDSERASSSLTKAAVIRKRRERIEKIQSVIEEICSSYRSYRDKLSPKRSSQQTSMVTPKSRRFSGRHSHVRRTLWNRTARFTPSPKSGTQSEDPLAGLEQHQSRSSDLEQQQSQSSDLEQHQSRPSFSLSSAASSFADEPARCASLPVKVWHSTPQGAPRRFISLLGTRAAQPPPPRATLVMKTLTDDWLERTGRRGPRDVLDRGERCWSSSRSPNEPPSNVPSAAPSPVPHAASRGSRLLPASRCNDESWTSQRSVDGAEKSTLIRIGIGDNRERVLSSDALTASSAITSFCAESLRGSRASQVPQQPQTNQAVAHPPVDLLEQLLGLCRQEAPVTFEAALRLTEDCQKCRKLGEGSSADVYMIRRQKDEESAVKVIPVGSEPDQNGELPMSLASVIAEGDRALA
ncbi:hypothetical protein MTO96_013652 [Rhipicephalus appendiculatus]